MREWQIVTVAFRLEQQVRHRLADDVARPTTTARAPLSAISYSSSIAHDPERRARDERRAAEVEPAGVHRVDAVDVLRGSIASIALVSSM